MANKLHTHTCKRLPKPVTVSMMQKPFTPGFLYIAAWQGHEVTGPFGHGDDIGPAINELVDVTEDMLGEMEVA